VLLYRRARLRLRNQQAALPGLETPSAVIRSSAGTVLPMRTGSCSAHRSSAPTTAFPMRRHPGARGDGPNHRSGNLHDSVVED